MILLKLAHQKYLEEQNMEIYHNDYDKNKDPMMWELHEIRNQMQQEKLSPQQISKNAQRVIKEWKKRHKERK